MITTRIKQPPSGDTFSIKAVRELLQKWIPAGARVVDPFARNSKFGTITNDLNPETNAQYHMEAREFLDMLNILGEEADVVLLDPPYSPRQISECYKGFGRKVCMTDTQNAVLYKECIQLASPLLRKGGIAIRCGWNTSGFGAGFTMQEILLCNHGAGRNDTIVTVETKD